MSKNKQKLEYIVGIDAGSTKIVVLVAKQEAGITTLLGSGLIESQGIKKGVVVDIQSALGVIEKAIIEAESISGIRLQSAIIALSGIQMQGLNSTGKVQVRYQVVNDHDVMSVLQSAEAITLPASQEIIYTTPRSYTLDEKVKADNPIGMHGDILTAEVHLITSDKSSIKNITQSVTQASIRVEDIVPGIIAAAEATLSDDEKKIGACVIDIGGGTSDIAIYYDGALYHTEVIENSAYKVTTDVMHAFSINQEKAEEIKKQYGCALSEMIAGDDFIDIKHIGDDSIKQLSLNTLAEVIEARYEDIFDEVNKVLRKSGYLDRINTIVLTGGGSAIKGCARLAERYFSKPVRIGEVSYIQKAENISNNPSYAVSLGLLSCRNSITRFQENSTLLLKLKNFFKMLVQ